MMAACKQAVPWGGERWAADPGLVGKEGRDSAPLALAAISVLQCCWCTLSIFHSTLEHHPVLPLILLMQFLGLVGVFCQAGTRGMW